MKKYSLLIICITLLQSCSDVLDKGPKDKFSENDVWKSPELVQSFIYTTLNSATSSMISTDSWTDNSMIQEDGGSTNVNKEQIDRYFDAGWNKYGDIRSCNMILQKVPNAPFIQADKDHFISQAKMMRAMIYFTRARLFGKLMIVDRVIDANEDMRFSRTKTIKETYDFILNDLQDAASDLPVEAGNKQGILTRGAALALIAEVALHGAAYIEEGAAAYYELGRKASEELFALGVYELDSDYKKLFNDFTYAMNSKEVILAQWRHADNTTFENTWMQQLGLNTNNDKNIADALPKLQDDFLAWPLAFPSVDLVNSYLVVDEDGKAKEWNQTSYYNNFKANGGYVSDAIYTNRDSRFYATVVYDSTKYFNSVVTTRTKGNIHWNSNVYGDWGMTKTGYVYRKCVYEVKRIYVSDPTYYHYNLLRLGRSYLNYAEIMLRQGNVNEAIVYINKTRTKHGNLPELPQGLSLEDAWSEYKRERRVELTMEGDRYWSLLRWGKVAGQETIAELNLTHQAISISADGKNFEFIPLPYRANDNIRVFTSKRYLMPVPQSERDMNPSLDQNQGW